MAKQTRTDQTRNIEALLKDGNSVSTIVRITGLSRQRVFQIKKRLDIGTQRMEHRDYIRSLYKEHEKTLKPSKTKIKG